MKRFPIQDGPSVPWEMIEPHERQAVANHDQTLRRLAERGGLSCYEALCVLHDERLKRPFLDQATARTQLRYLIDAWDAQGLRAENFSLRSRAETAECERDAALTRCRSACQTLVEEFGRPGPIFVEEAARAAVARLRELRERAEKAEALAHIDPEHRFTTWRERCEETGQDLRAAQARLARYEASGAALLTAEHDLACTRSCCACGCAFEVRDAAYREQHARCVAVVSRVAWQSAESEHSHGEDAVREAAFAAGVRAALAALTGEAEK